MSVEFRLLGEVSARARGQSIDPGPARQRCVLAALAVDVNRVLSVSELMTRVWGVHPPTRARATLSSYISRLRQVLADDAPIVRRSGGYVLLADPGSVDLYRFRDLRARAARTADDRMAERLLAEALDLWRGAALTGLDSDWAADERDRLDRERLDAECDHTDVRLRLGYGEQLVTELAARAAGRPRDERVACQYLLALYRAGRAADALEHYRRVYASLAELGTDPGPALRELHRKILDADPALTAPRVEHTPMPRQLPAAPGTFVGRHRELARLDEALTGSSTVAVAAIAGAGGIGKTWLALHWAHRHLDRFPDGQLFVDLRGFSPDRTPLDSATAVRGFLDALGVDSVPSDPDAAVGLYRSLVADRRMLVVLDNARDPDQVAPLIPGGSRCTVLITSRHALTGLIATSRTLPVPVDLLGDDESREVLARQLGPARVDAEPAAVDSLLRPCAGLPLALGIVAARAATTPDLPLQVLADELRDRVGRLDAFDTGDPALNLRALFGASYQALYPDPARLFRLLGLVPGPDADLTAVASLAALPVPRTRALLGTLESANLVHRDRAGRYRMHDLVRLYAGDLAGVAPAAVRRLVDHYTHNAFAAERLLYPTRVPISLSPIASGCAAAPPADEAAAWAWFQAEYPCVLAVQDLAVEAGLHAQVWQLAWALETFHQRQGLHRDMLTTWSRALTAAQHLGDDDIQVLAHRRLGYAHFWLEQHGDAVRRLHQALALAQGPGAEVSRAHTHYSLAQAWTRQERHARALRHATRALGLYRDHGEPLDVADGLNIVGWLETRMGHYEQARTHCESALALYRRHQDEEGESAVLDSLGNIAHQAGWHSESLRYYREALGLCRRLGRTLAEAEILERTGHAHAALGDFAEARLMWEGALALYRHHQRTEDADRIEARLFSRS
ncbi:DNA-binding SARP family transcriptional activator/tetratricopeptide (TPR) repeat protein [Saccharothrix tamanrassetensis]|uniref:DNA-binding SARP family transcriptional activator/tetratricopeptide (TPR) repeat protein n=1 Tax=Saccharothrix tamanrassetensis TaxID=1051531 RepID=A0A841CAI2_9PSEU|nr:BTAD domain-containing putative transcriptional regulator [Saccharothrix tamanrassetensis]MBB5953990.1 DNA-binding SARP family transcriptional activator/tetratricopeptide (TPR) repeat protein [Saccharothrix tamanrassetensis]